MIDSKFISHLPRYVTGSMWSLAVFLVLIFARPLCAQVNLVPFSTSDPGVTRAITNWGVDTCWPSFDNMQRGLIFMGTNNVNIVRVGFFVDSPLTNNDVTLGDKTNMQTCSNLAGMATAATRWDLNLNSSVNSWYENGANTIYPDRWAAAMEACQRYYNRNFWAAEGFNEPDYTPNGEGSGQNLESIFGYLQASTNFSGTAMEGGSTLNDDEALSWFNPVAGSASIGSTHCLAGSASGYVTFIQTVLSSNAVPFNPELHNLVEAIMGANYGLYGGIWWGTAELARGSFVSACQGKQLGYSENDANWTAAAVYRGTNGAVQAFLGGSERMAVTTTYRFFCKDRDVFYDGQGPQRDYTVTVLGGNGYQVNQPDMEKLVNITWGSDVPPPINGRYIIANRRSGLVMEVPGGSTNNGTLLDQNTYTGANYQQWDVSPVPSSLGGDVSYYTMTAAHDGITADDSNFSYSNGNPIQQYNGGTNTVEQWYFKYAGNGYFYICSRWSGMCLDVTSSGSGTSIVQWGGFNQLSQQWRLIPVGNPVTFTTPAAPTGLTAMARAVSVQLNWNTNSGATPVSYTVLRATNSSGSYDIIARGLTNNAFTDNSANLAQAYYYVVEAVDGSVNTSGYSTTASATPTLAPAIVAHYHFDGNADDSSGNSNNAVVISGSPAYVAGQFGSALELDGTNQYVMLPPGLLAGTTNFTLAAWVYWNGGAQWQRIFDFGNNTTQYMFLTPDSGSGTLRFAVTTNGTGGEQIIETTPLPTNQWVHVAVTYDGSTARLYTNGVRVASGSVTLNLAMFNPGLNYLGQSQYPADPQFCGALDEFVVANYAMSAAQVAWLSQNSSTLNLPALPALVHRYSFNETGGTVIDDSVGGATWNGTLPNGGTFGGGQLALSAASSQYVNLPAGILSNYTAVTIEAWATFPDQISYFTMFFSFGNTNGTEGDSYLFCAPESGRIAITSTDYTGEQAAYSGLNFSEQTNLHITAVFDPPAGYLAIYTNGVLAGINTAITKPLNLVTNVFSYIGRSLYSGDTYFDCSLNEFRIYDGVMQPADVAAAQLAGPDTLLTLNASLTTSASGGNLTLSWPVAGSGFTLESSPTLGVGAVWTPVTVAPAISGVNNQITINPTNTTLFFRLQR